MSIRILLADDHCVVREGFHAILAREADFKVVATAVHGMDAVQKAREHSPDVVVIDVSMPEMNGIEATREILAASPATRILALSMHDDRQFVTRMIEAGAHGYLLKECACEELVRAIHAVAHGRAYFSARLTESVLCHSVSQRNQNELSPRERQTLQLVAEGHSSKAIAAKLKVSQKTVETDRQRIMEKLNVHSVAELTKHAIREGITVV